MMGTSGYDLPHVVLASLHHKHIIVQHQAHTWPLHRCLTDAVMRREFLWVLCLGCGATRGWPQQLLVVVPLNRIHGDHMGLRLGLGSRSPSEGVN